MHGIGRRIGRGLGALAVSAAALVGTTTDTTPAAAAAAPAKEGRLAGPLEALADGGGTRIASDGRGPRPGGPADPTATGPGTLQQSKQGVLVEALSDDVTDALVADLRAAGAAIVHVDRALGSVALRATAAELQAVAAVPGVRYVQPVLEPVSSRAGAPTAVQGPCGSARSEGDSVLKAAQLRAAYDVEGAGIEVGILSDSWATATGAARTAAQDIASGDLPGAGNPCPGPGRTTPADILSDKAAGTDEGRAMGQTVHDLAPGAALAHATAFNGIGSFAANIAALVQAGADVLVDDVYYLNEPTYQNGPVGIAAEQAVAGGVPYFSAIGNDAVFVGGRNVSAYEAAAVRPVPCPAPFAAGSLCHDFDPGPGVDPTYRMTVNAGQQLGLTLQWDEPWNGVTTDLDLVFLNGSSVITSSVADNPASSKQPFEYAATTAGSATSTVDVVVQLYAGSARPRFKLSHVRSNVASVEWSSANNLTDTFGSNTYGHPVAPGVVSTAAVRHNDLTKQEVFSSHGAATWTWGPVSGATAAARLATPRIVDQPVLAAVDGTATTFFGSLQSGVYRFYGTSAAAPHAAAVAALLLDCNAGLTPAQITSALTSSAVAVPQAAPGSVGAGLIDAAAAGALVCPPTPTVSVGDASVAEGDSGTTTLSFPVTLSEPAVATTSVQYATTNGTATAPGDYAAKGTTTLTFAPGETTKQATVTINGDTLAEADETLTVTLANPQGLTVLDAVGAGTIVNDDALPGVSIGDASIVEGNSGTSTVSFPVNLSGPSGFTTTVRYATANGTAVAPSDFVAKGATTLTFAPGETTKQATVTINGDAVVEDSETFAVHLSDPTNATLTDGTALGTIVTDDFPPVIPAISVSDESITEGNSGTRTLTFRVWLSSPALANTSVRYSTANGTAVAPGDYTAKSTTTLTFSAGQLSRTVSVVVKGDTTDEPDETLALNLSNPVGATLLDSQGVGTIVDDDPTPPVATIDDVSIQEGASGTRSVTLTVRLSHASNKATSLKYRTANGTAIASRDYTAKGTTTLSIAAGLTSKTFTITIRGDRTVEPNETFSVLLSSPSGLVLGDSTAIVTILDDD